MHTHLWRRIGRIGDRRRVDRDGSAPALRIAPSPLTFAPPILKFTASRPCLASKPTGIGVHGRVDCVVKAIAPRGENERIARESLRARAPRNVRTEDAVALALVEPETLLRGELTEIVAAFRGPREVVVGAGAVHARR